LLDRGRKQITERGKKTAAGTKGKTKKTILHVRKRAGGVRYKGSGPGIKFWEMPGSLDELTFWMGGKGADNRGKKPFAFTSAHPRGRIWRWKEKKRMEGEPGATKKFT